MSGKCKLNSRTTATLGGVYSVLWLIGLIFVSIWSFIQFNNEKEKELKELELNEKDIDLEVKQENELKEENESNGQNKSIVIDKLEETQNSKSMYLI